MLRLGGKANRFVLAFKLLCECGLADPGKPHTMISLRPVRERLAMELLLIVNPGAVQRLTCGEQSDGFKPTRFRILNRKARTVRPGLLVVQVDAVI